MVSRASAASGPGARSDPEIADKGAEAELHALIGSDPARAAPLLYMRFRDDVHRIVSRLLGTDSDQGDIEQQVFVSILRHAGSVRQPEKLAAWVQSIAVNAVYEEVRKRQVRRLYLREARPSESAPNLVREVEARDLLLRTKTIVDKLPAKERVVFMLHVVEGKTLAEVATTLGYSLVTAKRRLAAANKRFLSLVAQSPELVKLTPSRST